MALFHTTVVDNQIKALDTIGSASGSIATFETDKAERLVNLEVAIVATQSGSGTPSPSNPRAITGFDSGIITRCGKNLFDYTQITSASDWTVSGGVYSGTIGNLYLYARNGFPIQPKWIPNQQYVFKLKVNNAEGNSRFRFVYTDNTYSDLVITSSSVGSYVSVVTQINKTVSNLIFYYNIGGYLSISEMCLELGDTATTYEEYNGTTETIPFGQTVYGGRLNVGSGVLTVTHGYISDLGALNWVYNTSRTSPFFVMPNIISPSEKRSTNGEPFLCSVYSEQINVNDIWNGTKEGMCVGSNGIANNYHIVIRDTDYTDVPTFKTALIGQSLVYELATPLTIQLDSKQIQTIANSVNNIYADTGDIIDLKFVLSVGKAIS